MEMMHDLRSLSSVSDLLVSAQTSKTASGSKLEDASVRAAIQPEIKVDCGKSTSDTAVGTNYARYL